jgi:ABC-type Fe3+-hydroxamate transport system substrate-binding protein
MPNHKRFIDMLGREILMPNWPPVRIVSLVPSITETVADFVGEEKLVGVTSFCVHPRDIRKKATLIGGTKNVKWQEILDLKPDLVIANKEENYKDIVNNLAANIPVYVTEVNHTDDALDMILKLGEVLNAEEKAIAYVSHIQHLIASLPAIAEPKTCAYVIWKNPYMVAGGNTYIHSMLEMAGLENIFGKQVRYPETSLEQLESLKPDYILLSTEPYSFKPSHVEELKGILPSSKIILVDGEVFSWFGTRMVSAFKALPSIMETWL